MSRTGTFPRRAATIATIGAGALLLHACSLDLDPEPTATAGATAVVFGPGDVAVGSLIDESRVAWEDVSGWMSETRVDAPSGDDAPGTASAASERFVPPAARHVVTVNGDTVVSEEIVVDGTVYMRGTLVSASIYPDVDAQTWIAFQPAQAPPDTVLDQRVDYLTSPPAFPFETVTAETRALPAEPAGEIALDDRTCTVYRFTSSSDASDGIEYRIAFDELDRPCQLVRSGGGVVETTTWSYLDEPEPITAPDRAIPVEAFPSVSQ